MIYLFVQKSCHCERSEAVSSTVHERAAEIAALPSGLLAMTIVNSA